MKSLPHNNNALSPSTAPLTKEVIYTPDSARQQGWRTWRSMVKEVWDSREIIGRLILRDFSVRYRQSVLGYIWAVLPPIGAVAVFTILANARIVPVSQTSLPYVIYALWSVSVWQLFAGCMMACTNSLTSAGSLVANINFPKETVVIAAIGQPTIDFLIRLIPVAVVFVWYGVGLKWQILFMPLLLMPSILLALGLGFALSVSNLISRDVGNFLGTILTFGMILTPALYPPPTQWPFRLINLANPFSPLLIATQDLLAYGALTMPKPFLLSALFSILVFMVGWRCFRLAMPRIAQQA